MNTEKNKKQKKRHLYEKYAYLCCVNYEDYLNIYV